MNPTLFGVPMSGSANEMTALDETEKAPVPGATQTTSGVGLLLLRAQKTFYVPLSVPVRTVSIPPEVYVAAFPLHAV